MKKELLIGILAGSLITGFAFFYFFPPKIQAPLDRTQSSNVLIKKAQEDLNKNTKILPVEFTCNNQGCIIPQTSLGWSGLDGSQSTCVWTVVGGSGAIASHIVTTDGGHILTPEQVSDLSVTSVLCQNYGGEIFYGTPDTKIVPATDDLR